MENDTKVIIAVSTGIATIGLILLYQKSKASTMAMSSYPVGGGANNATVGPIGAVSPASPVATYQAPPPPPPNSAVKSAPVSSSPVVMNPNNTGSFSPVTPTPTPTGTRGSGSGTPTPNVRGNSWVDVSQSNYAKAIIAVIPILREKGRKDNAESLLNQYNAALAAHSEAQIKTVYANTINELKSNIMRFHPTIPEQAIAELAAKQALADNGTNAQQYALSLGTLLVKKWNPIWA